MPQCTRVHCACGSWCRALCPGSQGPGWLAVACAAAHLGWIPGCAVLQLRVRGYAAHVMAHVRSRCHELQKRAINPLQPEHRTGSRGPTVQPEHRTGARAEGEEGGLGHAGGSESSHRRAGVGRVHEREGGRGGGRVNGPAGGRARRRAGGRAGGQAADRQCHGQCRGTLESGPIFLFGSVRYRSFTGTIDIGPIRSAR